ncbi:hypothetical protein CCACVL1_13286 [Corchorus capsularis]|uniref:Uncharacterized protein n=1 Tax=Corchorus capsularis TaxID=210143 RepID=A0A1R3IBG0_COCAP|nr:hypothetical protein CCACVL1_13286 [Corchorus capsularis]
MGTGSCYIEKRGAIWKVRSPIIRSECEGEKKLSV